MPRSDQPRPSCFPLQHLPGLIYETTNIIIFVKKQYTVLKFNNFLPLLYLGAEYRDTKRLSRNALFRYLHEYSSVDCYSIYNFGSIFLGILIQCYILRLLLTLTTEYFRSYASNKECSDSEGSKYCHVMGIEFAGSGNLYLCQMYPRKGMLYNTMIILRLSACNTNALGAGLSSHNYYR